MCSTRAKLCLELSFVWALKILALNKPEWGAVPLFANHTFFTSVGTIRLAMEKKEVTFLLY
jgi:hypothetical protein